ncbi:MAG TPA: FAD:protein FMN transferase [Pelovirga sp.]|nr:FAD:protein FMN transferase [Pelovirga sp.]
MLLKIPLITTLLFVVVACQQYPAEPYLQLSGETMGTTWSVVVRSANADNAAGLKQQLQQQLDHINALMSTYDPKSEVSRFNNQTSTDWFTVSEATLQVVELAQEVSELTAGAFDITVAPLVELWGFGATDRSRVPPSADQVREVLAGVGYEQLHLRRHPAAISKKIPGLRIDLSAIAKGYAVDVLAAHLDQQGMDSYLVEVGGEMKMAGQRPDGTPWRIAIERPLDHIREVATVFPLTDTALATSGNYRNFYEIEGERYVHTIDPVSGSPIQHQLASATVLDPSCARADALATALMVMGEKRGQQFSEEHRIAAHFLIHNKTETSSYSSPFFLVLLEKEKP